jgi:hypothetical protein
MRGAASYYRDNVADTVGKGRLRGWRRGLEDPFGRWSRPPTRRGRGSRSGRRDFACIGLIARDGQQPDRNLPTSHASGPANPTIASETTSSSIDSPPATAKTVSSDQANAPVVGL